MEPDISDKQSCLQDATGLLEKSELAEKVKEVASQGPEGQASTSIPNGYVKDDASGKTDLTMLSMLSKDQQSKLTWLEISPLQWYVVSVSQNFVWSMYADSITVCAGSYFNSENQMYFDAATGGFYSGVDGKWYLYDDASQQFQEWIHAS